MSGTAMATKRAPRLTTAQLQEEIRQRDESMELLQERLVDLELALEDEGWERVLSGNTEEFTRDALLRIVELARIMAIKNPLIKRGLTVQVQYVFGQGLSIEATDAKINDVVQAFLDDPKNQTELTSELAFQQKERELATDGNQFLVLFVSPSTGRVRLRSIPFSQIEDVVSNPEDAKEPWFYKRVWTESTTDLVTGFTTVTQRTAYYPDWQYRPTTQPATIGTHPVHWYSPIYHIKVGGYSDWKFGLSEVYAAIDWAKAYKSFLEDWATITRSLARYAWKATTKGGKKGVAAIKTRLATTQGAANRETNPPATVAATAVMDEGVSMDPMRTSGATTKMEDGRRLLLMVAAAMNLPETFFGDVSVGTLATATSLDRPTELAMRSRQAFWTGILEQLCLFVITWAVRAPKGALRGLGTIVRDGETGTETVRWTKGTDPHVDVDFPPIVQIDPKARVDAIVASSPKLPAARLIARLLLSALGEDDIDRLLDDMFNADGTPKEAPPVAATGTTVPPSDGGQT